MYNICSNGTFEVNVAGWILGSNINTFARSTADSHSGVGSGEIVTKNASGSRYVRLAPTRPQGKPLQVSFWAKAYPGTSAWMDISIHNIVKSLAQTQITDDEWTQVVLYASAEQLGATSPINCYIRVDDASSNVEHVYIDDVIFDLDPPIQSRSFADAVQTQMVPVDFGNSDLGTYLGAIGAMFEQLDAYAHNDIPWSDLLNVDTAPDEVIAFIGQLIGVSVDDRLNPDQQRQQIRSHLGWGRGTVGAIKQAIRPFLSGSKTVEINERDSSPYHFQIVTYADETGGTSLNDPYQEIYNDYLTYTAFYNAYLSYEDYWLAHETEDFLDLTLNAIKPAGLVMEHVILPGSPGSFITYENIELDYNLYRDVWNGLQTYGDVYTSA